MNSKLKMQNSKISIFTDGSSRGNPGPGGWGAIISTPHEVRELGGREDYTTNNRMELSAAINALVHVSETGVDGEYTLQTDSKYVIQGITSWVSGWEKNGWKTAGKKDVINKDLWEALAFASSGLSISWKYVEGHAGHPGNERCDEIATSFADNTPIPLYHGIYSKYPIDLKAEATPGVKKSPKKSSSAKAYSYLSLVGGALKKHATWAECEARVRGVKGAKFKKAFSASDEDEIAREWGMK
jgi:ribonuclease HI